MSKVWVIGACIVLVYPHRAIRAQSDADSLAIDIAAARAMLGHQYTKGPVSVDPVEGAEGHAPPSPGVGRLRSTVRTEGVAKAVSALVRRYSDVASCSGGQTGCALSGISAHIILSAPTIGGDSASVTATIYQNAPSKWQRVDYETVLLTVVRTTHGWAVVKEVQLGVS